MPKHKGHLPGDTELTGRAKYRPTGQVKSAPKKKVAAKKVQSMDELMGKGWRDKGVKKRKPPTTPKVAAKPKKKKFVSKRVIKKPVPLTASQKKEQAEARARKKRAMKVLKKK